MQHGTVVEVLRRYHGSARRQRPEGPTHGLQPEVCTTEQPHPSSITTSSVLPANLNPTTNAFRAGCCSFGTSLAPLRRGGVMIRWKRSA